MASPDPTSTNQGQTTTAATSHTLKLPVLATGDLLIIYFVVNADTSTTWPAGWVEQFDTVMTGNAARVAVAYHEVTGSEGYTGDGTDMITVTTSGAARLSSHISHRYTGQALVATQVPTFTTATGTSANPDPPDHTPGGGALDYLYVAIMGVDRERTTDAFPTDYGLVNLSEAASDSAGVGVATAARKLTASSANPGTFTVSASDQWLAATFAIWPAASGDIEVTGTPEAAAEAAATAVQTHTQAAAVEAAAETVGTATQTHEQAATLEAAVEVSGVVSRAVRLVGAVEAAVETSGSATQTHKQAATLESAAETVGDATQIHTPNATAEAAAEVAGAVSVVSAVLNELVGAVETAAETTAAASITFELTSATEVAVEVAAVAVQIHDLTGTPEAAAELVGVLTAVIAADRGFAVMTDETVTGLALTDELVSAEMLTKEVKTDLVMSDV